MVHHAHVVIVGVELRILARDMFANHDSCCGIFEFCGRCSEVRRHHCSASPYGAVIATGANVRHGDDILDTVPGAGHFQVTGIGRALVKLIALHIGQDGGVPRYFTCVHEGTNGNVAGPRTRILFIVILDVLQDTEANLLEIALTGRTTGVFTRSGKHREKNSGKDCYNRYND